MESGYIKENNSDRKETTEKRKRSGGNSSSTPSSARSDSAGTSNTGTDGTGGTAGEAEAKKEGLGILVLNEETPKPKQRKPKKVKKTEKVDNTIVNMCLGSVFTLLASRPGMEHWAVSDDELNSISVPLSNILNKSDAFAKIAENSDAIALATAALIVCAPRVMITVEQKKQKSKKGVLTNGQHKSDNGSAQGSVKGNVNAGGGDSPAGTSPSVERAVDDATLYGGLLPEYGY